MKQLPSTVPGWSCEENASWSPSTRSVAHPLLCNTTAAVSGSLSIAAGTQLVSEQLSPYLGLFLLPAPGGASALLCNGPPCSSLRRNHVRSESLLAPGRAPRVPRAECRPAPTRAHSPFCAASGSLLPRST